MAVVYADLRFTKASGQVTGVTPGQTGEDWNITYENIPSPKEREDPTQSHRTGPRGLQAPPYCVCITLILLSCSLAAVVIGLSVQLSQVSGRHLNTAAELQQLRGEHEDLGSRYSQNDQRKDSMVQMLKGNQKQTQQELEKAKASLYQVQEKWKTTAQELQRAVRETEEKSATLRRLQEDLLSTKTELQRKESELSRCENDLRSIRTQKSGSDRKLDLTSKALDSVQKKLRKTEESLSKKNAELSSVRSSLQEVTGNYEDTVRASEQQLKNMSDLEQRLRDAGKCLTSKYCSDILDPDDNTLDAFAYCPAGWYQIGEMCYYFSSQKRSRIYAEDDCKERSASLAKVEDEAFILMDAIKSSGQSYWIGLHKMGESWMWPDKTIKEDFPEQSNQQCVKAAPHLVGEVCRNELPWICEMRMKTCGSKTETLRCLGEKVQIFGEKYQEQ